MNAQSEIPIPRHDHVFLGADHERNEKRTWIVIWVCAAVMVLEIVGGILFGSVALIADGLHMFTHAGALLLAALAYKYARRHAHDARFTFGTGKLGDLAAFASAIILAMIALLIAYEAIGRLFHPRTILFPDAIAIACFGLVVNVASAWILGGGAHPGHDHSHSHSHSHGHAHGARADDPDDARPEAGEAAFDTPYGRVSLRIEENDAPPRFHLSVAPGNGLQGAQIATRRANGARQDFLLERRGDLYQSVDIVPEPHEFEIALRLTGAHGALERTAYFAEAPHEHGLDAAALRDNNMRAALVHVMADAAVSLLVIGGLGLAWALRVNWIDPVVGLVGAGVVASWAFSLARASGAILLDMNPDEKTTQRIRRLIEENGDRVIDLHVWRLGPGHLGAILEIATTQKQNSAFYRDKLARENALAHVTIEVRPQ